VLSRVNDCRLTAPSDASPDPPWKPNARLGDACRPPKARLESALVSAPPPPPPPAALSQKPPSRFGGGPLPVRRPSPRGKLGRMRVKRGFPARPGPRPPAHFQLAAFPRVRHGPERDYVPTRFGRGRFLFRVSRPRPLPAQATPKLPWFSRKSCPNAHKEKVCFQNLTGMGVQNPPRGIPKVGIDSMPENLVSHSGKRNPFWSLEPMLAITTPLLRFTRFAGLAPPRCPA